MSILLFETPEDRKKFFGSGSIAYPKTDRFRHKKSFPAIVPPYETENSNEKFSGSQSENRTSDNENTSKRQLRYRKNRKGFLQSTQKCQTTDRKNMPSDPQIPSSVFGAGLLFDRKNNERFRFSNGRALPNERKNRETIAIVSRSAPFFGHFAISAKPSSRKKNRPCEVFSAFRHRSAERTDIRGPYKYRTRARIRRYIFHGWNADS